MERCATADVLGDFAEGTRCEEDAARPKTSAAKARSHRKSSSFERMPNVRVNKSHDDFWTQQQRRCKTSPSPSRSASPAVQQRSGKISNTLCRGQQKVRKRKTGSKKRARTCAVPRAPVVMGHTEMTQSERARAQTSPVYMRQRDIVADFLTGLHPPKKLDIGKLCNFLEDESPAVRAQALRGLLAAYAHRQDIVPPWTAARYLPSVWSAARRADSPGVLSLVLRLVRCMATTGEPWVRALIDAGLYRELANWICASPSECVELPQWGTLRPSTVPTPDDAALAARSWSSAKTVHERVFVPMAADQVRERVFATCTKVMRCVQKYGGKRENQTGLHAVSLRSGSLLCLMACLQKVQENCKFDEYDFRRHELVYEAIQAYGGPQRLQEDMKDTMEHMRRVRIAQQAVLAERAMAAALGVERESSLSPGVKTISCAYKPLPAHLVLCGGVMDATGLNSETEARRVFDRLLASSARVEKREAFRQKCVKDNERDKERRREQSKALKASKTGKILSK